MQLKLYTKFCSQWLIGHADLKPNAHITFLTKATITEVAYN